MKQVYIAHERVGGGLCKIGYSGNPSRRVRQIEDESGVDLTLTYETRQHPRATLVEVTAHRILRERGMSKGSYYLSTDSEWFNATPAQAKAAVLKAIRIVNAYLDGKVGEKPYVE